MTTPGPGHTESEAHPWRIDIPDHPKRQDSAEYRASRARMNDMAAGSSGLIYGSGPYQDHHGGSLWLKDAGGWFMVRNLAGIEWSAQFCADPAKVDLLRENARRLYALMPPEIARELDPDGLLDTPITDAAGVARWTDSIFNAGVPLHAGFHTGVLPSAQKSPGASAAAEVPAAGEVARTADSEAAGNDAAREIVGVAGVEDAVGVIEAVEAPQLVGPAETPAGAAGVTGGQAGAIRAGQGAGAALSAEPVAGGVHHYPTPVADIQLFKYDDFQLWVTDEEGNPAAVAPVSRRGSGDACVHVLYATPGSRLARRAAQARRDQVPLILGPDHPISVQAYIHQPAAAPGGAAGS